MGVSLLNFFDLKPLNTSKRALNTNHPFFWDTLYILRSWSRLRSVPSSSPRPACRLKSDLTKALDWTRLTSSCVALIPSLDMNQVESSLNHERMRDNQIPSLVDLGSTGGSLPSLLLLSNSLRVFPPSAQYQSDAAIFIGFRLLHRFYNDVRDVQLLHRTCLACSSI